MQNGLNSFYYIRNNKRKVRTLIIIFTLFITMIYGVNFYLSPISNIEHNLAVDERMKMQTISCSYSEGMNEEEFKSEYQNLLKKLDEHDDIKAFSINTEYINIHISIGEHLRIMPLLDKKDVPIFLEEMDAVLSEGRMPENSNEILVDRKVLNNICMSIGDEAIDGYKIVGVLDSDFYLTVGINSEKNKYSILTFSDGEKVNIREICNASGTNLTLDFSDKISGQESYDEVLSRVQSSVNLITTISTILIAICVIVFMSMSFRDRYDEWCLYRSIGFSSGQIYFSVMREIGIIILASATASVFILTLLITLVKVAVFEPNGYVYTIFSLETIFSIVCILVLILGILQIPLAVAMRKIRTVDAIEEDVY